jgi:hypothetical protein
MHVNDGILRAYHDDQLDPQAQAQTRLHLESCPECRVRLEAVQQRLARVETRLEALAAPAAADPRRARLRLETEYFTSASKETTPMWQKLFAPRFRPAWTALVALALVAGALAIPSVRAAAVEFLGLFRVQQIEVIEINPEALPDDLELRVSGLEQAMTDQVSYESRGERQEVADAAQASQLAGFAVRLPGETAGQTPALVFQPGADISFEIDLQLANTLLDELGRSDLRLPAAVDGAVINVIVPDSVVATYGACTQDPESRDCTALVQMPSPTLIAPPGVDARQMGEIYLQLLGLTADEAAEFSARVDWSTTLVVPVPRGADYQKIEVDQAPGIMFQEKAGGRVRLTSLVWQKDGMLYALSTNKGYNQALRIANSLP